MRDQADLRKQAKCHAGCQRDELEIAPQLLARKRARRRRSDRDAGSSKDTAIRGQTHLIRCLGKKHVGQNPDDYDHHQAVHRCSQWEAQETDRRDPER